MRHQELLISRHGVRELEVAAARARDAAAGWRGEAEAARAQLRGEAAARARAERELARYLPPSALARKQPMHTPTHHLQDS